MEKIFLYKTITKSVAYDEEHWYIGNILNHLKNIHLNIL